MVRKLFIAGLVTVGFLFASPVFAQGAAPTMSPEFNPLCWKRAACEAQRRQLVREAGAIGDGFITGDSAYPCRGDVDSQEGEWGRCLPANVTKTEIAFGGERTFVNLGDFLQKNYNLAIAMAGIIAAIVVILSGFQWAMSGGNAETISGAKHRITNAVIGMFIAYTSYFILNTINPDLVNLRLPQTWLLRPLAAMPRYCYQAQRLESQTQFALATKDQNVKDIPANTAADFSLSWDNVINGVKADGGTEITCGSRYFMKGGGSGTCYGNFCGQNQICSNLDPDNPDRKDYSCISGSLVGEVTGNYLIPPTCGLGNVVDAFAGYKFPWIVTYNTAGFWNYATADYLVNNIYQVCLRGAEGKGLLWVYPLNAGVTSRSDDTSQTTFFKFSPVRFENNCGGRAVATAQEAIDSDNGELFLGYAFVLRFKRVCTGDDIWVFGKDGKTLGAYSTNGTVSSIRQDPNRTQSVTSLDLYTQQDLEMGQRVVLDAAQLTPQK